MALQGQTLTLNIDPQGLRDVLDALLNSNRVVRMTAQYGETVPISKASKILNRSRATVYSMIKDGRLRTADGRVDVVSIAEYLDDPRTADQVASFKGRYRA